MKLISAKYHNFMSFGETENELNFEEVFADGETLLVVGIRDGDPQRSNGAGKSSVVEGLPYALFGRLPRIVAQHPEQKGEVAKEIIRTDDADVFVAGESYVELKFKTGDGRSWRLKRGRKVNKKCTGHSRILELECVDSAECHTGVDAEKAIAEILRFSFEALVNSCMFAQRDSGKFLSGSDSVKKDLFMELVGVQVVDRMLANVRRRKSTFNQRHIQIEAKIGVLKDRLFAVSHSDPAEQTRIWESDLKKCDEELDILEKNFAKCAVDLLRDKCDELERETAVIRTECAEISNERQAEINPITESMHGLAAVVSGANSELSHVEELKKNLQDEFDRLLPKISTDEKLAEMRQFLDEAKQEFEKWTGQVVELSKQRDESYAARVGVNERLRHGDELVASIQKFLETGKKGEPCPTCGSQWNEESAQEEIRLRQEKLEKLHTEKDHCNGLVEKFTNALHEAQSKLTDARKKTDREADCERIKTDSLAAQQRTEQIKSEADQVRKRQTEAETKRDNTIVELDGLQKRLEAVEVKYKIRLDEKRAELKTKEDENNSQKAELQRAFALTKSLVSCKESFVRRRSEIMQAIAVMDIKIAEVEKDNTSLRESIGELAVVDKDLNRILLLEEIMSKDGFKTKVAEKYVPHMDRYANEFLSLLSPDSSLSIKMDGNDIKVAVQGASSSDYIMCSGGEQETIRLAVNMANSMIAIGGNADLPGIVLLDEIFGSLDPMTRRNVFMLLERLGDYFPRIVVITHDLALQNGFSKRLVIAKDGKVARIAGVQKIA